MLITAGGTVHVWLVPVYEKVAVSDPTFVRPEKDICADVVPRHTDGIVPGINDGPGITVTCIDVITGGFMPSDTCIVNVSVPVNPGAGIYVTPVGNTVELPPAIVTGRPLNEPPALGAENTSHVNASASASLAPRYELIENATLPQTFGTA
jgi:hypothetical protein